MAENVLQNPFSRVSLFRHFFFQIDAFTINKPSPKSKRILSFKRLSGTAAGESVNEKNVLLPNNAKAIALPCDFNLRCRKP